MIQRRSGARLVFHAPERHGVAGQFFRQEFQRDTAAQLQVFRLVHHSHAAAPENSQHAVVGHFLPGQVGSE